MGPENLEKKEEIGSLEKILDDLEKKVLARDGMIVDFGLKAKQEEINSLNKEIEKDQKELMVALEQKFKIDINTFNARDAQLLLTLTKKEIKKRAQEMGGLKDWQIEGASQRLMRIEELAQIHHIDEEEKKKLLVKYGLVGEEEELDLTKLGKAA